MSTKIRSIYLVIATYTTRHEWLGPIIKQEMDLEKINIIQNFIYDDVPEKEDMIVI